MPCHRDVGTFDLFFCGQIPERFMKTYFRAKMAQNVLKWREKYELPKSNNKKHTGLALITRLFRNRGPNRGLYYRGAKYSVGLRNFLVLNKYAHVQCSYIQLEIRRKVQSWVRSVFLLQIRWIFHFLTIYLMVKSPDNCIIELLKERSWLWIWLPSEDPVNFFPRSEAKTKIYCIPEKNVARELNFWPKQNLKSVL